jgi:phage terminase Nu1 subunit (DNA packaging protein)
VTATVIPFPDRMADREPWVAKTQVAKRYGCSTKTIERWAKAGCPSRMEHGRRVFRLSEVETWLCEREAV